MVVQDILRECDKNSIARGYAERHACEITRSNKTVPEIRRWLRKNIRALIVKLSNIKAEKDTGMIFIASHNADLYGDDISFNLFKKSDVLEKRDSYQAYGYEFTPFEEAVGYEVADTYLMNYYLEDFIVEFLYEVTWTGFNQENLKREISEMEQRIEDADSFRKVTMEELFEGFMPEKQDPEQLKAEREFILQQADYCNKCIEIEVSKWRKTVR